MFIIYNMIICYKIKTYLSYKKIYLSQSINIFNKLTIFNIYNFYKWKRIRLMKELSGFSSKRID